MNAPATNKPVNKVIAKPNTTKPGADPEKAINQLRQEIRTLSKSVKEMQQKPDTKAVIFLIPNKLLSKVNAYLSDCERSAGITISLSELICDALDVYIWAEDENKRMDEEREKVELESGDKK
jgi:hypothetical protein